MVLVPRPCRPFGKSFSRPRAVSSGLLASLIAVVTCFGCGPAEQAQSGPGHRGEQGNTEIRPVPVTVGVVEVRAVERQIPVVGTLHGFEHFIISPKVEGRVETIRCDVGDRVTPRAELLVLDDTDYRLAVDEAQRSLETELAKLGVDEPPTGTFDLESNPGVVRARLVVEGAQQQFDRHKRLASSNASSVEALERAETEFKVAQAMLLQARLDVQATLAAVRHKQAVLELARQRLAETRVVAPHFDVGPTFPTRDVRYVVLRRMVSVGEMVRAFPSTPVLELALDDVLKFKAAVPERYVSRVREGQLVTLRVDAWPKDTFPARLSRINPAVDPLNRTFEIEALVPNAAHRLRHGGFVKAAIVTQTDDDALTVPLEALVTFAGVTKVFRIREQRAEEVVIKIGTRGKGWIEVLGDLAPQDLVVTSGQSQLADGTPVVLRESDARTAALTRP